MTQEKKMMLKAFEHNDAGREFFKAKEYKKAIGQYVKVELYIRPLASPETASKKTGDEEEDTMGMFENMKQFSLNKDEIDECRKLQATAFLNMSICHYILKNYEKAITNCTKSL